jgi:prophage antirepressor-like protein
MFENLAVRIGMFNGEPWWVAKDVMAALGYAENSDVSSITSKVPEEWKGHKRFGTLGGVQEMIALSEQGLYHFVARSDKPAALPFQKWVAGEVLPSIRKTGSYGIQKKTPAEMLLDSVQMLVDQEKKQREHDTRLVRLEKLEEQRIHATVKMMDEFPVPAERVEEVSDRAMVNRVVRNAVYRSTGLRHSDAFARLYREFRDRTGIDLSARARNRKLKNALDAAEADGLMARLYAVAYEIFELNGLKKINPV